MEGKIMKVKIFEFETSKKKTESAINEWLENNPMAKIKFITHTESGYVTISIWYEK